MIRRLFAFLLIVALAIGCGYNGWQAYQLRTQVAQLKAEVGHLKELEARRESGRHAHRQTSTASTETEEGAAAEGWLALASEHADKAKAAFDNHNFGIAQTEFNAAVADFQRGTQEPVQATESTLAAVRQKIAQLEGAVGKIGE